MATPAQILANQANAQHSSGPITDEGKARVAQNRLTHGLTGTFALMTWECPDQFQQFADEIRTENNPQTSHDGSNKSSTRQAGQKAIRRVHACAHHRADGARLRFCFNLLALAAKHRHISSCAA